MIGRRTLLTAWLLAGIKPAAATPFWDDTADVIVIGSGFAGLTAAIEARKAGADVLLIEKMASLGGNSALCAGDMAVPASPVQKNCGIEGDSAERMAADLLKAGGYRHSEHAESVAREALATWRWTAEELGVTWNMHRIQSDWGQSVPRGITLASRSGFSIVQAEADALTRLKVRVKTECRMDDLVFEKGRAVGVTVTERWSHEKARVRHFRARRGLVLAYGGFSADVAFRSQLNPLLGTDVATSNQPGATSEAWQALIRAGARMMDLDSIQVMSWNSSDERGLGQAWTFIEYATAAFGQWFDAVTGEALLKEDRSPMKRTELLLQRTARRHECLAWVSEAGLRESRFDEKRLADLLIQGVVRRFDDAASAAARVNLTEEKFLAGFADKRREGPFYAVTVIPKVHHSQGGLFIDGKARVYDEAGRPMPGLFAAGEATGGLFGRARIPSHSVTDALVMGRIAGREAARCRP